MEYVPERHDPHIDMILMNNKIQNFTACEALFWINLHQTRLRDRNIGRPVKY